MSVTTFIIPTIDRPTLQRAAESTNPHPVLIGYDDNRDGESYQRNQLIREADTEWVSFLDDDDTVTADYVERLEEEIRNNPDADVIHFRQYFLRGHLLPSWPEVEWGNIGICFSMRRELALEFPFINEEHEDYELVKRLQEAGKNIVFSKFITYRVRH